MVKKQDKNTSVFKDFTVNISKKGVGIKVERTGEDIYFDTENLHLVKNIDDMYDFLKSVQDVVDLTAQNKISDTIDECCNECNCCICEE